MISGKIEPPNKFVKYLIEKMRDIHTEREIVQKNLEALQKQGAALNSRHDDLMALGKAYFADIMEFDEA